MNLIAVLRFIVAHPLNKGQRIRAVSRFVRWQIASRLMSCPMAVPFVDDIRILLERGMTGATGNYYCGLHEAEDMAFVLHFLRPGDQFYDIGANIGSYSLLAAAAGVDQIMAFDPSTESSVRYARNMRLNGLNGSATLHCVALGESIGEVSFTKGSDTTNHVVADDEHALETEPVPLRRFDEFFVCGRRSFIKMDVEGFESRVLAGAAEALRDPELAGLLVESNGSEQRYSPDQSIIELLEQNGFKSFSYDPGTRTLSCGSSGKNTGNLLFLRDESLARERVALAPHFQLINGRI